MKILRIVSDLYPRVVGGLGLHVHYLSEEQAKKGHDVTIYTCGGKNKTTYENGNYKIYEYGAPLCILGNSISFSIFPKIIKSWRQYDIVHAHSHLFLTTNMASIAKLFGANPLVITTHGIYAATAPKWLNEIYMNTVAKFTLRMADKVICYTNSEKEYFLKIGISYENIEVIPNGINTQFFSPNREVDGESDIVLWVGRYVSGKGVEYLIKAINILRNDYPKLKLIMVGTGPEKEKVKQTIKIQGLEANVIMRDFVENKKIVNIYRQSKVFVLPSLVEGVPRTILEAMSCKLPVITTDLPQLRDIISGCGIMVPPADGNALAVAIDTMLRNKKNRVNYGNNGRQKVIESYSWQKTVERTLALYATLL